MGTLIVDVLDGWGEAIEPRSALLTGGNGGAWLTYESRDIGWSRRVWPHSKQGSAQAAW